MIVDLTQLTDEQRAGLQYEAAKANKTAQEFADALITRHAGDYYSYLREQEIQNMRATAEQLLSLPEEDRSILLSIPGLSEEKRAMIVAIVKE